ncbi:nucleotidyltransferase family protein [Hymenobacter persicinus]|uniref:Nucleotidyltransferase family protein n=1 Tax=Hymenobacter persicinus TaxID=2025506 RepID=A0A4Q5LEF7_9BACT|nr:nucleotidyltransferase family protein [Hymenobacter persicinus]RYU82791.1 nucleotidyltransferase family protein [Hymenobacter persicinus]
MASFPVLLLAAGASSRLGRPKQLLVFEGQTLLRRAAETAVAAAAGGPVVVVTGAQHDALLPELTGLPLQVVRCAQWEQGMGASLQAGLAALEATGPVPSVAIMLCDQPFVTPALLRELAETHVASGQPIVASAYDGTRGVPVFFSAAALPWLRELPASAGAGQLLRQHPQLVATVSFAAGAVDVDTADQYAALLAGPPAPASSAASCP